MRQRVGGTWGAWTSLGGYLLGALTVAAPAANQPAVAGIGVDTALWIRHLSGGTWSAWSLAAGVASADPVLTARVGGAGLLAAMRGGDDAVWVDLANPAGTTWSGWGTLAGVFTSGPAATLDGTALDLFARGLGGRVYQNVAADGTGATGWSGWQPLP